MRSDRYTKFVLTVIAVCLSVLTLTGIGLPDFTTEAEATVAARSALADQGRKNTGNEAVGPKVPTATLPLRWRIPTAFENIFSNATFCTTVVSVLNATASSINVQVEWTSWGGFSQALRPMALPASEMLHWVSDHQINIRPYFPDDDAGLEGFSGYVNVHADDPRILVTAIILCRDDTFATPLAKIRVHDTIPAYPVGTTAQYFQAGMPATWTPPMASPETPE
jgi:hypothetical protein